MAVPSYLDVLAALAERPEGETLGQQDFKARWDVQGGAEFRALLRLLEEVERAGWMTRRAIYTRHFQYAITRPGQDHLARSEVRR